MQNILSVEARFKDMSQETLLNLVDPYRLAKQDEQIQASISLAELPRIQEELHSGQDLSAFMIAVQLVFGYDADGLCCITGHIKGNLPLTCQRCMKMLSYQVDRELCLSPVDSYAAIKKLPEAYAEVWIEERQLNLVTLVEDELLLSLPVIAKHQGAECELDSNSEQLLTSSLENHGEQATTKANPFAVLEQLKGDTEEK